MMPRESAHHDKRNAWHHHRMGNAETIRHGAEQCQQEQGQLLLERPVRGADSLASAGVASSARIIAAKNAPMMNAMVTTTMYISPMRLWSLVRSHDATVDWWLR